MEKIKEWYVAELLVIVSINGAKPSCVDTNFVLLSATSPEAAIARAQELGDVNTFEYVNNEGLPALSKFVGIRDIHKLQDELADGCELFWQEEAISKMDEALSKVSGYGALLSKLSQT